MPASSPSPIASRAWRTDGSRASRVRSRPRLLRGRMHSAMLGRYALFALAAAGAGLAAYTVLRGTDEQPPRRIDAPRSPYATPVVGSGLVEANTENIAIGTQIAGIVKRVNVRAGDQVKAGDPLFEIDDRAALAEAATQEAAVLVAGALLAEAQYDARVAEPLVSEGVGPAADLERKRLAVALAEAQVSLAEANLRAARTELERLVVRAPIDGQGLQLRLHVGELAAVAAPGASPLMILGNVTPLHVRVDVDEYDAWRIRPGGRATGYLRGNHRTGFPLSFVRFEPYVTPKKSLTGDAAERVDTRVQQVIFSLEGGDQPISV